MGRRRNEGLLETLGALPWPAGIAFGLLGFATFRWGVGWYASSAGGRLGEAFGKAVLSGGLEPIAWLFLALGFIGAGMSAFRSRDRARLLDEQKDMDSVRGLSWARFEQLVGEAYRRQGYSVEETGQGGADGGIDLLLRKDGAVTLVQCKYWRSRQVGVSVVREMLGLMQHHQAAEGKIVCTGVFSADCFRFAVGKPIELVDGRELARLVSSVRNATPAATSTPIPTPATSSAVPRSAPTCPRCKSDMVERTNRTTGSLFWGCSQFPRCQGTVSI
jgi:restriction system protein